MQNKVNLSILAVGEIVGNSEIGIISLVNDSKTVVMGIVCDKLMMRELHLRLAKKKECNTMLPELLVNVLQNQVGYNFEILINDIIDGEYKAMFINSDTGQVLSLRAADAVLLHIISDVPIYVTANILRRQGMPYVEGSAAMALPINVLTDKMLNEAMEHAVDTENYEMASKFRDELKKRGKSPQPSL